MKLPETCKGLLAEGRMSWKISMRHRTLCLKWPFLDNISAVCWSICYFPSYVHDLRVSTSWELSLSMLFFLFLPCVLRTSQNSSVLCLSSLRGAVAAPGPLRKEKNMQDWARKDKTQGYQRDVMKSDSTNALYRVRELRPNHSVELDWGDAGEAWRTVKRD